MDTDLSSKCHECFPFAVAPNKAQSVSVEELENLYSSRFGVTIPSENLAKLGFDSTISLIQAIPHVVRLKGGGSGGGKIVVLQQNLLERWGKRASAMSN